MYAAQIIKLFLHFFNILVVATYRFLNICLPGELGHHLPVALIYLQLILLIFHFEKMLFVFDVFEFSGD